MPVTSDPSKRQKRPPLGPGTEALLYPRPAGTPADFSAAWRAGGQPGPTAPAAAPQPGAPPAMAPRQQAPTSGEPSLQPAVDLTHYDGFPIADLQSDDGRDNGAGLSDRPGFELAARRSPWESPYPQSGPRPPIPVDHGFAPRYEATGEPRDVPNPADLIEYFAEFPKIRRDFDSMAILADRHSLQQNRRYRVQAGQGLFRVPGGSYTADTYSFNDPEQTMFVELPTWPDGYTLFEFSGTGRNRTWRTGNYPPRSLHDDPPMLRDPVYRRPWIR